MQATECDYEVAEKAFQEADNNVKVAIVMVLTNNDPNSAKDILSHNNGFIREKL